MYRNATTVALRSRGAAGRSCIGAVSVAAVFAAALAALSAACAGAEPRKKAVATGWDQPDLKHLLENQEEIEKRPFDGVVCHLFAKNEAGKVVWSLRTPVSPEPWQREWFDDTVRKLQSLKWKRFTDNFLNVDANPGNVDWFDDAAWQRIADKWRIIAHLARFGGFRGICFDPEPYYPPAALFSYRAQPQRNEHTFAEYCAKARQRGREMMRALTAEYPDITLLCYFLNSVNAAAARQGDPQPALAAAGYGLLPALLDGWLDEAPATVKIIDGCESAYLYNSVEQYLEAAVSIKGECQRLVSPENRAKYRAQVQVGFGIYLDAYWNPPGSPWYIDGKGGSRLDRLRDNLRTALRVADEYVWVYGEKHRWWPTANRSVNATTWPEVLPGVERFINLARDPLGWAAARLESLGSAADEANLLRNGRFSQTSITDASGKTVQWQQGRPPVGWSTWQREKSRGTFAWDRDEGCGDKGSARCSGVDDGCFLQSIEVKPGEIYVAAAMRKLAGAGEACLRVRWQTPDGKWTAEVSDVVAWSSEPRDKWGRLLAVAEVPPGAGRLVVLLLARGQRSPDDIAWFDGAGVWKLE